MFPFGLAVAAVAFELFGQQRLESFGEAGFA